MMKIKDLLAKNSEIPEKSEKISAKNVWSDIRSITTRKPFKTLDVSRGFRQLAVLLDVR